MPCKRDQQQLANIGAAAGGIGCSHARAIARRLGQLQTDNAPMQRYQSTPCDVVGCQEGHQAGEDVASCEVSEQSAASSASARHSTGTEPAQQQASSGDSNAVAAGSGGAEAATAAAATAASQASQMGVLQQGQGAEAVGLERMGAVQRLSKQFSEQVSAQHTLGCTFEHHAVAFPRPALSTDLMDCFPGS